MNLKHLPPEPLPSHADRRVRRHNPEAGHSYLAVARPLSVLARRVRGPPVPEMDRADGWLHRLRSSSKKPATATTQEEGIYVQLTDSITRPAGSETSLPRGPARPVRVHAP